MIFAKPIMLLSMVGAVFASLPAQSASFVCADAKSASEKLICSDAKLSAMDGELGVSYRDRLGTLSPTGKDLLRQSQRSWLTYANRTCLSLKPKEKWDESPVSCLRERYRERLSSLKMVGQQIGPFRFNRVDLYNVKPAPDDSGLSVGFYVTHLTFPQIDEPKSAAAVAWNNRQSRRKLSDVAEEEADTIADYELGFANAHFISLQRKFYTYRHGAAHGTFSSASDNVIMNPGLRPATGKDIFGTTDRWVKPLQNLFWKALQKQGWQASTPLIEKALKDAVAMPNRWHLSPKGLRFDFDAYEGGCYVCNPKPVTMSWDSLKALQTGNVLIP